MSVIEETAHAVHHAFQIGGLFPESLAGKLSLDDAYRAQILLAGLLEGDDESVSGWKVGLTAKAMQQQQGMDEPCFGHLFASGQVHAPARLTFDNLINPGFENELCLKIGKTLDGPDISHEEARAAIEAVAPALEIIEKRSAFQADFGLAMAGNAQQRHYVTGAFVPFTADMLLAEVRADVFINHELAETAFGREVLGDPVNSVVWLAKKLHQFDRRIEAGQHIMSGSFTRQHPLNRGDSIRATFNSIGTVETILV